MDISGNLKLMNLPTLVQAMFQDDTAKVIRLSQGNTTGIIHVVQGALLHATVATGDSEALGNLYAPDAVNHQVVFDPIEGREAIQARRGRVVIGLRASPLPAPEFYPGGAPG